MDKLKISTVAAFIGGSMLVSTTPSFCSGELGRDISQRPYGFSDRKNKQDVKYESRSVQATPSYFFKGMARVEGEDLRNYGFLEKIKQCCGFSVNLFQARFSGESMGMDLKKATMVLTLISVLGEISANSPITFEEILRECENPRPIAESEINSRLGSGDPFAYFVENHNNLAELQNVQLEPIAVLVLDVFGGNGPGPFENFFQKLTAYDLSGNRAELTAEENDDSNIQRLLKMGNISMQTEKGGELWIPDWKNRHRNKRLLFFITCDDGLYSVEFSGNRATYGKYLLGGVALGAVVLAAGMFIGTSD